MAEVTHPFSTAPKLPAWLAEMVPYDRRLVDVGEHRVHVMETSHGSDSGFRSPRTVLMVHGNPTWGFLYRKIVAQFSGERFRFVLPDLVGLGFSDKPRDLGEHTLDNHQRWLADLVEALDLREVLLVVQDWGGPIGLGAFSRLDRRLAGVVVLNTVVGPPRPGFRSTRFHRFARTPILSDVVFRVFGFPQVALWLAQGDRASIRGATARAYRYPLRRYRDRAAPLALARMVPDSHEHPSIAGLERSQQVASSVELPAAIVWGDHDPILGRALRRVTAALPGAEVSRTQAGHFLQEEVPEVIAEAIRAVDRRIT